MTDQVATQEDVINFLTDPDVADLVDRSREYRPLQICYPREPNISRFLAWLLDPQEGHGLGEQGIRRLLAEVRGFRPQKPPTREFQKRINRVTSPISHAPGILNNCFIDTEYLVGKGGKKLDVLLIIPKQKLVIGIENKFGASQGQNQLKDYRLGVERVFKGWDHLFVFMDSSEKIPNDKEWINIGYDWINELLKQAKTSPTVPEQAKSTICEFLAALDNEGSEFPFLDLSEDKIVLVVNKHRKIFEQFKDWEKAGLNGQYLDLITTGKPAHQARLFELFWQKQALWKCCTPSIRYSYFLSEIKREYPKVNHDPLRVRFRFELPEWECLKKTDDYCDDSEAKMVALVQVRIMTGRESNKTTYRVISAFNLKNAKDNIRVDLINIANEISKRRRTVKEDQNWLRFKIEECTNEEDASKLIKVQIRSLNGYLSRLL